jgi:hypothetical protein
LLLESANFRLTLCRDKQALAGQDENRIDEAPRRSVDGHLGDPFPSRVECCKQSLDHRRLNPIMNPWPGRRVEPDLQIGAEDVAKRNENAEARLSTACLDLREISMVDPRSSGERPLRQVRVDTQPANLFADAPP